MEGILVPIFICVVLPVAIVLIVFGSEVLRDRTRANVLTEAIRANANIDTDKLAEALGGDKKKSRTPRELLNLRLLRGCIFALAGVALCLLAMFMYEGDKEDIIGMLITGGISLAIGLGYLIVYFGSRKQVAERSNYHGNRD